MCCLLHVPRNRSLKIHIVTSLKLSVYLLLVRLQLQDSCFSLCIWTCDHSYSYYIILIALGTLLKQRGQEFTDIRGSLKESWREVCSWAKGKPPEHRERKKWKWLYVLWNNPPWTPHNSPYIFILDAFHGRVY